ncbi:hypothetical protein OsJ_28643 [Oryza sativa Japonica Group]|uniref:Uncharacterized protein n=1 Tax=Oryza sativa subsp. japonica TaxID=39947 RepID=A3BWT1_ORYSJ|nr:hypothetical protein OsJ_28643 [Oryza sativa Japonica Group]
MQGGRSASAVEAAKEAAANVGASAWAGKEKTKAVVEATVDKARAPDTAARDAADARKADPHPRGQGHQAPRHARQRRRLPPVLPRRRAAAPAQAQPVGVGGRAIDSSAAPAPAHTAAGAGVSTAASRRPAPSPERGVPWAARRRPRGETEAPSTRPAAATWRDMQAACRWPLQRAPAPAIRRRMSERMELCLP